MSRRDEADKLISRIYRLGFDNGRGGNMTKLHEIGTEYVQASARLLALLAPEPEPSDAEIEAGARAIYDATWHDDAWHLQDEYYRESLRQRSKAALTAARAARQTGGEK